MKDEPRRAEREGAAGDADEVLLDGLRRRDRTTFAVLVRRHSGAFLRVARALVKNPAVAEEIVQETWLALLTSVDAFEGRSSLRTWLFQILVNKARTRAAREGRSVPFSALVAREVGGEPVDADRFDERGAWREAPSSWTNDDPERLALGVETRAAIETAIGELPEAQRAVITLRDVEGLETEEICNLLGITVTNQRVLLHRARARVRRALEGRLGSR
jgi:RNA polymerase sigma-70 factor (ECF subfamily)